MLPVHETQVIPVALRLTPQATPVGLAVGTVLATLVALLSIMTVKVLASPWLRLYRWRSS
jgi:hypothetical protein